MRAIQFGVRVTSVVIPHLRNSTLAQELKNVESILVSLQKGIEFYTKENIGTMIDQTLLFLEDLNQHHEAWGVDVQESQSTKDQSLLNDAEVLEGVELKQLENFLCTADKERTLGNLYRSVTKEGHVKWVCRTHFRQNYGEQAQKRLFEVVEENRGEYDEQRGKVLIQLDTKTLAKAFYSVLVQTHTIQELDITLMWDASLSDIRLLTEAILKSTVASLCIQGGLLKGPVSDLLNNSRRYDPILQLLATGQLQVIQLQGFPDFFDRVSNLSTIKAIPSLRTLVMCRLPSDGYEGLLNLVGKCMGLQRLTIHYPGDDKVVELLNVSPRILELEVIYSLTHIGNVLNLSSEIAKLKGQDKGDKTGYRLCFQSLVARQDTSPSFVAPRGISQSYACELVPIEMSVSFSEDGIAGISTDGWDVVNIKPFINRYGWALLDPDLVQFQIREATRSVDRGPPLDYGAWSKLIDKHGGVSGLESLRYHGSLLIEEDRPALLSIIDKSPKLERLEILFSTRQDREVVSWHLEHLASQISMLLLMGHTCFKSFVDIISRDKITLPKLTEFRCKPNLIPHDSHKMTWERWCQLFATMDFSMLKVLAINEEPTEDLWYALLDSLPKEGLMSDGKPVALTAVKFRPLSIVKEKEYRSKCLQLSERAPFAILER